jgi:hypothetical protein
VLERYFGIPAKPTFISWHDLTRLRCIWGHADVEQAGSPCSLFGDDEPMGFNKGKIKEERVAQLSGKIAISAGSRQLDRFKREWLISKPTIATLVGCPRLSL